MERIILHDDKISNLAQHTAVGKLVGANGKYATYADLVTAVKNWMNVYCYKDGFYGLRVGDEPSIDKAENFGLVVRAIKDASKELGVETFILLNLLPSSEPAALKSFCGADDTDIKSAYAQYLSAFIDAGNLTEISVDSYPFKPDGMFGERFLKGHLVCLQTLAEVCAEKGVSATLVMQSFEYVYNKLFSSNGWEKIDNVNDMHLQVASALSFGIENFAFYTYVTHGSSDSYTANDGSSPITKTGEKTEIYNYMQSAITHAKVVRGLLDGFTYSGSLISVSSSASTYGSIYTSTDTYADETLGINVSAGTFVNASSFADLVSATNNNSIMLVTELTDGINNVYAFQNLLTKNYATKLGTSSMTVTAQFNPTYQKALVYTLTADGTAGTWEKVTLTNGVFTADIPNGLAVYVMPCNW